MNRTLRIAAVDVAFGRIARLRGPPREGPEFMAEPPFHCDREIGFTALTKHSFAGRYWPSWARKS